MNCMIRDKINCSCSAWITGKVQSKKWKTNEKRENSERKKSFASHKTSNLIAFWTIDFISTSSVCRYNSIVLWLWMNGTLEHIHSLPPHCWASLKNHVEKGLKLLYVSNMGENVSLFGISIRAETTKKVVKTWASFIENNTILINNKGNFERKIRMSIFAHMSHVF